MQKKINLQGKSVTVNLTKAAEKELSSGNKNIVAEMELYFSCLIRKQVRFKENLVSNGVSVNEHFAVCFRPVMTKTCGTDYQGDEPPLEDFPIKKPESYIPHWLKIDFKKNKWIGEFGY